MSAMPTSDQLNKFVRRGRGEVYELFTCYRQRERLAKLVTQMTEVLAQSSPFKRQDKIQDFAADYSDLLARFNVMDLVYPQGEFKRYDNASTRDFERRIQELSLKPSLWTHWPPILSVIDDQLPQKLTRRLGRTSGDSIRVVSSSEVGGIKGVDFQHVVMSLSEQTFSKLEEPFQGSGRTTFAKLRLLRIPFSRARDSLSLFVWANSAGESQEPRGREEPANPYAKTNRAIRP